MEKVKTKPFLLIRKAIILHEKNFQKKKKKIFLIYVMHLFYKIRLVPVVVHVDRYNSKIYEILK
ncbi:MAG: hypothetical protein DMG62_25210 [Acidobacteria bacterium]|nr:MAG: hypothetical protein DMG62_25210 [Acidobacteriota bacterium]